jgi:S-DNA-T family DNA segregation ATPase FtsK/SpoIIIE
VEQAAGDDLVRLVNAIRHAAILSTAVAARPPWLPPLPARVTVQQVAELAPPVPEATPATTLAFGLVDLPESQSRGLLTWDLATEGHLAIVGAPGSGRTGTLRALAAALGRGSLPVHIHMIDGGGGLADLANARHVGTVVPAADTERAGRLLHHLRAPGDTADGVVPDRHRDPRVVVLIDGWEQVLDAWYPVEHGRLVDELLRLARGGAGTGVHLAVAGGRCCPGRSLGCSPSGCCCGLPTRPICWSPGCPPQTCRPRCHPAAPCD